MGGLFGPLHNFLVVLFLALIVGGIIAAIALRTSSPRRFWARIAPVLPVTLAVVVILGAIGWLARTGYESGKSYYVKVPELLSMGDIAHSRNLRVDGYVVPGSIERNGPHVDFLINEFESHMPNAASGRTLKVSYKGSEPPPDTFKDDAEAVADGAYGRDGVFHATALQAKCASKYAPAQPGAQPSTPRPASAANAAPASSSQPAAN